MEGYFANYSTMPEMLSDLVNLTMTFVGGAAEHPDGGLVVPSFEVGGIDVGPVLSGFDMNFALGGLNLASGTGKLDLTDGYDNQPGWEGDEALYVIDLNITDGCELNLNGHRLYYLNGSIAPSATVIGGFPEPIPVPGASAEFDGVPTGHSVTAETDIASSAGYGTMGMREGEDNDIRALSWTVHVDEAEVADAIAAASEDYLTLIIGYDAQEIELLGMDETSLRPYRWDEDTAKWILGGTTTDGLAGMSEFIDDLHSDYHDYGLGFCGLNVSEDLLWINVNHASTYGVGGVGVPEPSPLLAWDNQGGDSTWATAANWDPDGVPDATLPARIANGDTVLLNSAGQAAKTVSVENSSALHVTTGGQLTVAEDMAIKSSSKLAIAVSGSACGRADVTGMLQLEPTASLLLNWVPIDPASKFGGDYVVAAYGARTGEFSTIGGGDDLYSIGVAYVAGVDYETDNQITVSLHSLLDGDADLNGKVDFGDYMILEAAFGDTGGWSKGDFDLDGDVDVGDYMILEAAFGDTVPAVAAAAVPEPGTLVMLLGALAGLVVATRRRRAA
ncbi:MAG: PEP-CTERM sorting domain-containing protein [Candidatus Nealsonbacteria bacterium]|nr:PEP-CTERM sorting domain-containing protein [Candidatus Nealsonbacteria bacterium]